MTPEWLFFAGWWFLGVCVFGLCVVAVFMDRRER
jgi:hypothetical protein